MNDDKNYYAFISYKRNDQKWAEWLQEKLEHYKLPSNLNGRDGLPKEIRPVFRDKSELAAGVLADEIQKALDHSKYLIVICSPHSAKSEWVNKEVQSFIDSGRTDKIIPFIIEGTPNSGNDETECFPKAIRELSAEDELLGVNINEMGRDAAAVKVVAQMFGLRFDDLWQRHEREKIRRRNWIITASVAAFLVVVGIAGWIWHQNVKLKEKDWKMLESQSKLVSEMVKMNAKDDSYLARLAALEVLPKDVSNPVDRPYTAEAERALREASKYGSAVFKIQDALEAIFTPDDEQILVRLLDSTLRFIAVNTGCVTKTLKRDYVSWDLCYSPCGKHIISHNQKDVFILDAQTLATELSFVVDTTNIFSVKYSPDGNKIITTSGHNLKIWDAKTGDCLKTVVSKKLFLFATYSPDGEYIAVLERKKEYDDSYNPDTSRIIIYDDNYNIKRSVIRIGNGIERDVVFSPDSKNVLIPSYTTEILDIETGDVLVSIKAGIHIEDVAFSPDGQMVLAKAQWSVGIGSDNSYTTLKIWNAKNGQEIKTFNGHKGYVIRASFSQDGGKVISCSVDGTLRIWDLNEDYKSKIIVKNDNRMFDMKIYPDLNIVAAYSHNSYTSVDDKIRIWNIESGEKQLELDFEKSVSDLVVSNDGKQLLVSSYSYQLLEDSDVKFIYYLDIFDIDSGTTKKSNTDSISGYSKMTFSPDGTKLAVVSDGRIKLVDVESDSVVWFADKFHGFSFAAPVFSPDGKRVVCIAKVYDTYTGEELVNLEGIGAGMGEIEDIKYSPDGNYIVSGGEDHTVKIWDAATGKCMKVLEGHTNGVMCVEFSPDSQYVISGSKDKTIRVWDVETGICVDKLIGHDATIMNVAFASDGRSIISVSDDYSTEDWTIRIWEFPPLQELIDQTRERFKNRPLTEEERKMYYLE